MLNSIISHVIASHRTLFGLTEECRFSHLW